MSPGSLFANAVEARTQFVHHSFFGGVAVVRDVLRDVAVVHQEVDEAERLLLRRHEASGDVVAETQLPVDQPAHVPYRWRDESLNTDNTQDK